MNERIKKRLTKIRKENSNFNQEMIDMFADIMPDLLDVYIDGHDYDCHIGSKEVAELAEKYITDETGKYIGFHWDYDTVVNQVEKYINLNDSEFYPADIWVWANVKYGDLGHIISDPIVIIKYAISELTDPDYPFHPASQRAYYWLKKHIENEN